LFSIFKKAPQGLLCNAKSGNTDILGEGSLLCNENITKKELKKHKGIFPAGYFR